MTTGWNTGTSAQANGQGTCGFTVPAGVLAGDTIVLAVAISTTDTGQSTPALSFSALTWTLQDSWSPTPGDASHVAYIWLYTRTVESGDASTSVTITETGLTAGDCWWALCLGDYTGLPFVSVSANTNSATSADITTPTVTLPAADWTLSVAAGFVNEGTAVTVPSGPTEREDLDDSGGAGCWFLDSDGAGTAGSQAGGEEFSMNNFSSGGQPFWAALTILAGPGASGGGASVPHSSAVPALMAAGAI